MENFAVTFVSFASLPKAADDWIDRLQALSELHNLQVSDTSISDAAFQKIATHKALFYIDFSGTQVTDAGLARLKPLASLKDVKLKGSNVTAAGVAALQKALPGCKIERNNSVKATGRKVLRMFRCRPCMENGLLWAKKPMGSRLAQKR